jgi:hypothetical protein
MKPAIEPVIQVPERFQMAGIVCQVMELKRVFEEVVELGKWGLFSTWGKRRILRCWRAKLRALLIVANQFPPVGSDAARLVTVLKSKEAVPDLRLVSEECRRCGEAVAAGRCLDSNKVENCGGQIDIAEHRGEDPATRKPATRPSEQECHFQSRIVEIPFGAG